mgnify:CR=1 FL=1
MNSETKITSKEQLLEWFKLGNKVKRNWRVGTEHEKFAYNYSKEKNSFYPLDYKSSNGIEKFLIEISNHGWEKILEDGNIIALKKNQQSITLEPGGQIELSGAPLEDIHSACKETNEHLKLVKEIGNKFGITLLGLGARPQEDTLSIPWMPKSRYKIMRNYMPKKGSKGLDMMLSTCTVQANLDYSDEQDMIAKTILSVKVQPIITALFANSPLSMGKPNGFLSKRRHIWMHTDNDRCGTLKVAFNEDFGFKEYVNFALSVPMYFIRRNNNYIDCSGASFIDFMSQTENAEKFAAATSNITAHQGLQKSGIDYAGVSPNVAQGLAIFAANAGKAADTTPQAYWFQGYNKNFAIYGIVPDYITKAITGEMSLEEALVAIDADVAAKIAE